VEILYRRCAGLDVHKQSVVACVRISNNGAPTQEVRSFATTTSGLLALADWLDAYHVEHVAMEATGVYWKPVWHVLEGHFQLILANAAHVKNVPGRKTDVNDAMWLADLAKQFMASLAAIRATLVRTTTGGAGRRATVMLAPELTSEQRRAVKVFELDRWFPTLLSCMAARPIQS
jgi:transposase